MPVAWGRVAPLEVAPDDFAAVLTEKVGELGRWLYEYFDAE